MQKKNNGSKWFSNDLSATASISGSHLSTQMHAITWHATWKIHTASNVPSTQPLWHNFGQVMVSLHYAPFYDSTLLENVMPGCPTSVDVKQSQGAVRGKHFVSRRSSSKNDKRAANGFQLPQMILEIIGTLELNAIKKRSLSGGKYSKILSCVWSPLGSSPTARCKISKEFMGHRIGIERHS